jgi:hypothetical protein
LVASTVVVKEPDPVVEPPLSPVPDGLTETDWPGAPVMENEVWAFFPAWTVTEAEEGDTAMFTPDTLNVTVMDNVVFPSDTVTVPT